MDLFRNAGPTFEIIAQVHVILDTALGRGDSNNDRRDADDWMRYHPKLVVRHSEFVRGSHKARGPNANDGKNAQSKLNTEYKMENENQDRQQHEAAQQLNTRAGKFGYSDFWGQCSQSKGTH